ncbi:MAG: Dihydrofolate reductase [Bacteroidetes bacterium ADurb.Bin416]|jgi:dihydrofolate reductase|nr:MAG: Dihydrofolate reductase [Bacteroidetes bacterium ADurb.Bin416]
METAIIVAIANNNAIGKDNGLLCHLPDDLKHFKAITLGHTVVMGRNTFFSLPNGALPKRRNIVLTFDDETFEGCETARSVEEALALCQDDEKVFFIGGASVYHQTYPLVDKLYLTFVHHTFEADTFFPAIDFHLWEKTFSEHHPANEACPFSYTYENFTRIKASDSL